MSLELELLPAVANVGFPIAITGYLLMRFESKLDKLTEAIYCLTPPKKNEAST